MEYEEFGEKVLAWFDKHGRRGLPWQRQKTPYHVWVSEIMLQQTRVGTVIPYFEKFIRRFPNVYSLADAADDEVMSYWAGLGYYARARNLHRCAIHIVDKYQGNLPDNLDDLQALPGIGRSTAGAILAQAFGKRGIILDGNVKRVLSRYAAIEGWPGQTAVARQLWKLAEQFTPNHRSDDYAQAIMDLGALICLRQRPVCIHCPLCESCQARRQGLIEKIPGRKPKKQPPLKSIRMMILRSEGKILLEKRPPAGIWGGLWSLPEVDVMLSGKEVEELLASRYGVTVKKIEKVRSFNHTFSHFRLQVEPWLIDTLTMQSRVREPGQQWYRFQELSKIGMPGPVGRLLMELESATEQN